MWYLFWFVGILLMCALSTLALVWSRGRNNSARALRFLAPRFIRGAFLSPFHQLAKAPNLPSLAIEITLIEPQIVGRSKYRVLTVND